jgi:hypothetical protein
MSTSASAESTRELKNARERVKEKRENTLLN